MTIQELAIILNVLRDSSRLSNSDASALTGEIARLVLLAHNANVHNGRPTAPPFTLQQALALVSGGF